MKIKVINKIFSALLIMGYCLCVQAQSVDSSPVDSLANLLAQTDSMTANFNQLTLDQDEREVQERQGDLQIRKPDHLFVNFTEPYEEQMVTNGIKIWSYDPDLDQVTIDPYNSDDDNPLMLLSASAQALSSRYEITHHESENDDSRFVLIPKQPDSMFFELSLSFTGIMLTELHYEVTVGQKTYISFQNIEINIDLPDETFELIPPDGVYISDSTL